MNIILFGPPGVGKSTLIGVLKTRGQRAIDLEDLYPNQMRFQIPNLTDNTFIGAADLSPKRKYRNAKKVLLYLPQKAYDARRAQRDHAQSGKASQAHHEIDAWLEGTDYDVILDVSPHPNKVVQTLISLMEGGAA
jgi:predicted ATPase